MEIIPAIDDGENDRLHWLALRGAEGLLSAAEARELSDWMERSESARHIFAGYCQLLVALECEPCLCEAMAASALPENVVTMPGCRIATPAPAPRGRRFARPAVAAGLAAALLIGSLAMLGQAGPKPPGTVAFQPSGKRDQTVLSGATRRLEFAAGRDIRLLLADSCFQCHGLDEAPRRAGLRATMEQGLIANQRG